MNFTDQYIKMCDCEEVQKIYCKEKTDWIHSNVMNLCRYIHRCDLVGEAYTFLPYQHQIQSLIFQYGSCQHKLLTDFYDWCTENKDNVKGRSMEEMWLMFYMWRDHFKVWDGEKWIKEK